MNSTEEKNNIDFSVLLPKIIRRWYLFVVIIPLFFMGAKIYLKYQIPQYGVHSSLRIGADDGSSSDALLNEITPFKSSWYDILDEITVINSHKISLNTVRKNNFKVAYYTFGDIIEKRLYKTAPFRVVFDSSNCAFVEGVNFEIRRINKDKFSLLSNLSGRQVLRVGSDSLLGTASHSIDTLFLFGEKVNIWLDQGFRVELVDPSWESDDNVGFNFRFATDESLVYNFRSRINVKAAFDESSIMNLSMNHDTPEMAIDYLNSLMESYREKDYSNKLHSVTKSLNFLREQIKKTQSDLNDRELIAQKLKDDTRIYDLDAAADNTYQQILVLQEEKEKYLLQLQYYQLVIDYIEDHRDMSDLVAPSLMGIDDPMVASIVENLRDVYVEKAQKKYSVTDNNPTYTTLSLGQEKTIEIAIENLSQGIKRIAFNLVSIEEQMEDKFSLLKSLPSAELNFLRVKREINGLNKLLEFLVEREAGLGISAVQITSNHQVVDYARLISPSPIAPKHATVTLMFLIVGLFVVGVLVFLLEFFNQKVTSLKELEKSNGEKALGCISFLDKQNEIVAFSRPNSFVMEGFRSLKHNLSFVVSNEIKCKIIGLTSTISGEGKTFVASNLGGVLALGGKRVLLIGADLRKPKLNSYFNLIEGKGLSEYLVGQVQLDDIIQKTEHDMLDVVLSGEIPPNPAEIIENKRFNDLILNFKERYDYIILDCPPVGMVSDYQSLAGFIDVTMFVVKQHFTTLNSLNKFDEYQLTNAHLIMNGMKKSILNKYGYGYGYGYYQEK